MRFRKKPVVIDAVQFKGTPESFNKCREFVGAGLIYDYQEFPNVFIDTLEGRMGVSKNDWIIKGVKGEFYPCKPDIFDATYERVLFTEEMDGLMKDLNDGKD